MQLDTNSEVVRLCAEGMNLEGQAKKHEAAECFNKAWTIAESNVDKFIAAHYVARHQNSVAEKLQWDNCALEFAQQVSGKTSREALPSLYLNVAKCYEDLNDLSKALQNYQSGLSYVNSLNQDGYGRMIKDGLIAGLDRVTNNIPR